MIMVDKRSDSGPEVPFAERHDARQTLGSDCPHKSLGKRVQIRTPGGQAHECHTTVTQQVPEGGGVERVSVENHVLRVTEEAVVRVREVLYHLCHPEFVRLTHDAGDLHGAGLQPHAQENDVADQSAPVSTSTVKRSAAARPSQ
jgi:hypothetical protein